MLLIIDNYDSFTYNLYHYFGELGYEAQVHRNDEITVDQIINLKPKGIVISPGPRGPEKAGISVELVKAVADNRKIPLLGVCLGHQAIGAAFGAKIISAPEIMHGKVDMVYHSQKHMIFENLSSLTIWELNRLDNDYKKLGYSVMDIKSHKIKLLAYPIYLTIMTLLAGILMLNIKYNRSKTYNLILGMF